MASEVQLYNSYEHYYKIRGRETYNIDLHNRIEAVLVGDKKGVVVLTRYDVNNPTRIDWSRTINHAIISYRDTITDVANKCRDMYRMHVHVCRDYEVIYDQIDMKLLFVEYYDRLHPDFKYSSIKRFLTKLLFRKPYIIREMLDVSRTFGDNYIDDRHRYLPIYDMFYDRSRDVIAVILDR